MPVATFSQLSTLFERAGVRTLYFKRLAPKQDNEKNQIVLGTNVTDLTSLFPASLSLRAPSTSELKRKSDLGRPITEGLLNFYWMDEQGNRFHAPNARLIDYFQYPEGRLSGFLKRCKWAPRAIRRRHQAKYGQRVLVMGSNAAGEVTALLLTEKDDPLSTTLSSTGSTDVSNLLEIISISDGAILSPAEELKQKLRSVIAHGWHSSVRNKAGVIIPFKGNQGAGYTLEALLGVATNASKEPDFLGHEIKSYRGEKLSIMTPTADGGPEGEMSFRDFMDQYGLPSKKDDGSIRFTGLARAGSVSKGRGLSLRVEGYDATADVFDVDPARICVQQYADATGDVLSSWSAQKLADAWNAKHASAVYVKAEKGTDAEGRDQYRFLSPFHVCEGTDVWRLLRAIARGVVYYDPAHSIYQDGVAKVRPQWRISTTDFTSVLSQLYRQVSEVT